MKKLIQLDKMINHLSHFCLKKKKTAVIPSSDIIIYLHKYANIYYINNHTSCMNICVTKLCLQDLRFYFETESITVLSIFSKWYYASTWLRWTYWVSIPGHPISITGYMSVDPCLSFYFLCRSAWGCRSTLWKSAIHW